MLVPFLTVTSRKMYVETYETSSKWSLFNMRFISYKATLAKEKENSLKYSLLNFKRQQVFHTLYLWNKVRDPYALRLFFPYISDTMNWISDRNISLNQSHLWGYDYFPWWSTCISISRKIFWLCSKTKFLSSVTYLNRLKSHFNHCPDSACIML